MMNNELVPMTRRYPSLKQKQLKRDSDFIKKLIKAWDEQKDQELVFKLFLKEKESLSPERYWETLRTIWILCGSVERITDFRKLFASEKRSRYYFSTPEEAKRLREMPDRFVVYRAADAENDGGISWTISRNYAEKYQTIFQRKHIFEREVSKSEVFALIERNKEEEILIL